MTIYLKFFHRKSKCNHEKITPANPQKFCPDCGKRVGIIWYIIKCECCNSKRPAILAYDTIFPKEKYCSRCGSGEYFIERHDQLAFFDYNFAVLTREELEEGLKSKHKAQIWIDKEDIWHNHIQPKLIPIFLK